MTGHSEGLAWLGRGLEGHCLTLAEGMPAEELAVRLGAPEGAQVLDAETIATIDRAAPPENGSAPDIGRIGDAGNGWSFVLLPCTAYWESGRTGPESAFGRHPSYGIRTLGAVCTGMDPARIEPMRDEQFVWGFFDGGFDGSSPDLLNSALADLGHTLPPNRAHALPMWCLDPEKQRSRRPAGARIRPGRGVRGRMRAPPRGERNPGPER